MIEYVTKRDGSKEKFDPAKMIKWAEWASIVGVDWFDLVASAYKMCHNGCTTKELHDALVRACLDKKTTAHFLMAGRLMVGELYKQVFGGVENIPDLPTFYHKMVENGYWEDMGYSEEELLEIGKAVDHSEDFKLSSTQVRQDTQKGYLITDVTTKEPKETPQFALIRQAMGAHKLQPKERRVSDVIAMYDDLKNGKVNTPTPNKTNLGTDKRSYASCCVSKAGDTLDSIEAQNHIYWTMTAASAGQGGYLETRSFGDKIRGGVIKHGGKLPYFRLQEAETKANMQGGRGGALTTYINALDPEVFTLLAMRNPTTVEDRRVDGIDNAFLFNDSFVERAKLRKDWLLISVKDAPDLWKHFFDEDMRVFDKLMDEYIASGKGNVVKAFDVLKKHFIEDEVTGRQYEMNATNTNRHTSYKDTIHTANLCLEAIMPTREFNHISELYETDEEKLDQIEGEVAICNLAALSVGRFPLKEYEELAYRTLLMVDNVIEIGEFPLPQVTYTARARRSVGIGITNLAYALADQGLTYDSKEGKAYCHRLAELHTYSLLKSSVKLAKERGACKWFYKTRYAEGWLPIDTYNRNVDNITDQKLLCDWESLRKDIAKYGLRNSSVVNHMPVESSSIRNNDTNGLYPIREGIVTKVSSNTVNVFIAPEWERLQGYYQLAWDVPHNDLMDVYAIFQKFADQGISADEYHRFDKDKEKRVSLKQLAQNFFYRQKVGMKTRYYKNFATGMATQEQEDSCSGGGCKL